MAILIYVGLGSHLLCYRCHALIINTLSCDCLFQDCCINAESLQDLFGLLSRELSDQWRKAKLNGIRQTVSG